VVDEARVFLLVASRRLEEAQQRIEVRPETALEASPEAGS